MEDNINISDYLRDYNSVTKYGTCRSCGKQISWASLPLASHKRASCLTASAEEKLIFAKRKYTENLVSRNEAATRSSSGTARNKNKHFKSVNLTKSQMDVSVHQDSCFVCSETLASCRTSLNFKLKLSGSSLYNILECCTGVTITKSTRNNSAVCHDCLISLQQYDKWQHKSSELQRRFKRMLGKTQSEQIFIKQEPPFDDGDDDDFNDRARETDESSDEEPIVKFRKTSESGSRQNQNDRHNEDDDESNEDWWTEEASNNLRNETEEDFSCVTCSKQFKNSARLEIHLATDHERCEFPFPCPKCSKSLETLNSLKAHYMNHMKPKSLFSINDASRDSFDKPAESLQKQFLNDSNSSSTSINPFELSNTTLHQSNIVDGLRAEIRGSMPQLLREIKNHNARFTTEISQMRNEILNLRNEMRDNSVALEPAPIKSLICQLQKITDQEQFEKTEEKLQSSSKENIAFQKDLISALIPCLNAKLSYSKKGNSLIHSLLTTYFDKSFLEILGWSSKDDRPYLNNKSAHINMFFITINTAFPDTFKTKSEICSALSMVLKRMREKNKRHSTQSSGHKP